jgi:hypothetical protein
VDHQGEPKIRTARKQHHCHWCGEVIEKGQQYETTFIVHEGTAWKRKLHLECAAAERTYDYDGETLYYQMQFQRGHNHGPNSWVTAEIGAKDGCPGCIAELAADTSKGSTDTLTSA